MVRVFRDTYKRGIHDYLDAIRVNAILARSLLAETGSFFLQIGAENIHRIAVLLDEIFGAENRIATITFCKTGKSSANTIPEVCDYILYYSKNRDKLKHFHLYKKREKRSDTIEDMSSYSGIELTDGSARSLTSHERNNPNEVTEEGILFQIMALHSQNPSNTGRSTPFKWREKSFDCPKNRQWTVSHDGLERLAVNQRLFASGQGTLSWKRYEYEIPGPQISNIWSELNKATDLHYVVETAEKVIERCILMSTEPGDLVLDITCGSGTTPFVAEKWGRRWIATDASRIPIALARQRVLSSVHNWWVLSDSQEGVRLEAEYTRTSPKQPNTNSVDPSAGFVYKRVPYVSAATLAYDLPPSFTYLVDRPHCQKGIKRIASPFTIESLSPYRTVSVSQYENIVSASASHDSIEEALRVSGCTLKSGKKLSNFDNFEPITERAPLTHQCTMSYGHNSSEKNSSEPIETALSIAPDDASCSSAWINHAVNRAADDPSICCLLIIAFNFESDAFRSSFKRGRLNIHCLRANRDLMIENLQITASDQAFVEIGEPDISVEETDNESITVEVIGYDTFNPRDGNLREGTEKDIQCWMIDTNYDEQQFFARKFHFPGKDGDKQITKVKRELSKQIDDIEWKAMLSLKSTPFRKPRSGRIAVRIITNTGVEMTTVKEI